MDFTTSNGIKAIVLAAVWLALIAGAHAGLRFAFERYERRLEEQAGADAAKRRTMLAVLRRAVIVLLVLIGAWSVLSVFPATGGAAKAFLASSAALGLILGLALSTPLGNLGSGILLGLTQPVRLGDRITVDVEGDQHTGQVERISLAFTTLITDEGRKIFVPNLTMTKNVIVNHSRGDRRRALNVRLPVAIDAAIDDACQIALEAADAAAPGEELELGVNVIEVTPTVVWVEVEGFAPSDADISAIGTAIRKRALAALAEEELLPAQRRVPERIP